jgi:hypothetical protein
MPSCLEPSPGFGSHGTFRVFKRKAQRRFVAWLAFAAMALIVLMPAISRSMSMPMDGGMSSMSGMGAHCPMTADHGDHHAVPANPDDPTARCGYCVLLSHNPFAGFASAVLWLPLELQDSAPPSTVVYGVPAAPLLSAHPRGPPLRING